VFQAVHTNDPDPKLLAYQYLQTLPQIAAGAGNTFWVIPSEMTSALKAVTSAFTGQNGDGESPATPAPASRDAVGGALAGDSDGAVGPAALQSSIASQPAIAPHVPLPAQPRAAEELLQDDRRALGP
jgi:hypothetical protein